MTENNLSRGKLGIVASFVGIAANTLLAAAKMTAGLIFGSIAVLADGLNNLGDTASSVISLIGFKMSNTPADKEHPYGHARFEYIAGLLIAVIIIAVGIELMVSSVKKLVAASPTDTSVILMIVLGISVLAKLGLTVFYRTTAKKINSSTVKAAATDSMNDVIVTSVILVCTVITYFTGVELDGYAGILVALFVLLGGLKTIKETLSPILGERPSENLVKNIYEKVLKYDGVLGIHDFMAHNYGPGKYYVSLHVEVDSRVDILKSHDLIDNIENDINSSENIQAVIHMDPIVVDDPKINALRDEVFAILKDIDSTLTMHDFRAVLGDTHNNLIFDVAVPIDCKMPDTELRLRIQNAVQKKCGEDCFTVISIDRNYI